MKAYVCILVLLFLASLVFGEEEIFDKKDWKKGAVITGITKSGSCVFKPFIQVGNADPDPDYDTPMILGYSPGNVRTNSKGEVVWERVYKEAFVLLHRVKTINGRMCKCPPYNY